MDSLGLFSDFQFFKFFQDLLEPFHVIVCTKAYFKIYIFSVDHQGPDIYLEFESLTILHHDQPEQRQLFCG